MMILVFLPIQFATNIISRKNFVKKPIFFDFWGPWGPFYPPRGTENDQNRRFFKKNLKKIGQKFKMSKNEQIWREAQVPERLKTTSI